MSYEEQRRALREALRKTRRSPQQAAIHEQLVDLADVHNDLDGGFDARVALIECAAFVGEPQKMLVAFTWCLGQSDEDPDRFAHHSLLWHYKWVLEVIPRFPQISRSKIDEMFDDYATRSRDVGAGLHSARVLRLLACTVMGDLERLAEIREQLIVTSRDWLADCRACEDDHQIRALAALGRHDEAHHELVALMMGGRSCAEVPNRTHSFVLLGLLSAGHLDEALEHNRRGLHLLARDTTDHEAISRHIVCLAATGNLSRALDEIERHLGAAIPTSTPYEQLAMLAASAFTLDRVAATEQKEVSMKLPAELGLPKRQRAHDVDMLRTLLRDRAEDLCARFEQRNANGWPRPMLEGIDALAELDVSCSLDSPDTA